MGSLIKADLSFKMRKRREIKSRFVRGTCRMVAFDDRQLRSVRHDDVPVCALCKTL